MSYFLIKFSTPLKHVFNSILHNSHANPSNHLSPISLILQRIRFLFNQSLEHRKSVSQATFVLLFSKLALSSSHRTLVNFHLLIEPCIPSSCAKNRKVLSNLELLLYCSNSNFPLSYENRALFSLISSLQSQKRFRNKPIIDLLFPSNFLA